MTAAIHAVTGISNATGRPLVLAGVLRSPLTLQRAQVATLATAQASNGTNWAEFGGNQARTHGSASRLLVEGQRSNLLRNPRCEGAVIGTPGTLPTFWSFAGTLGLSTAVTGTGVEDGLAYVDIRFFGTPTSTGTVQVNHDVASPASDGQVWTYSLFSRVSAGSLANVGNATLAATAGTGTTNATYTLASAALGTTRRSSTVTAAGGASSIIVRWRLAVTSGQPVDVSVRFAGVQLEQGPAASTPILPLAGSPASATRGTDLVSATLSALGIAGNGRATLGWCGVIPHAAGAGASQTLLQIDGGDDNNRYTVLNVAGGSVIRLQRGLAGATAQSDAGSMTAGTVFRLGLSIDGAGRAALSLNGGAPIAVTGGAVSGLAALRLGTTAAGLAAMFGETRHLQLLPFSIPDARLGAFTAALPG
jgi:hypothetical protein